MEFHLYFLCHRFEALVASHLTPAEFGSYMAVGQWRQTSGEELFFEIDPEKLGEAWDVEQVKQECTTHPDGEPRRSKYVSIYRAMERVPLEAFGTLYLTTRDGRVLGLDPQEYKDANGEDRNHMYAELCPTSPLVVSSLPPRQFITFLTDPENPVFVPKLLMADMLVDQEANGELASYLPYQHPAHISECLRLISGEKKTKTVDRKPFISGFFRTIRSGFFLGDQTAMKFYPYPSPSELDERHHLWWRSASLG